MREGDLLALDLDCMGFRAAQFDGRRVLWFEACGVDALGRLTTFGGNLLDARDAMPWGRWHDPETGNRDFPGSS